MPTTKILELLLKGREAYLRQDWDAALELDAEALALASSAGDAWTRALCHRFVGLCEYRLGGVESLGRSEQQFGEAIGIARALGDTWLRLVVSNHLGATLRDLGRHDEAYGLFREALQEAVGPDLMGVRARLLGNLGALLDELGQRASADDCYARYEELVAQLDEPRRLANARALAGRAALMRGDLEEAQWRFDEERRSGEALGERRRRSSAHKHLAELAVARLGRVAEDDRAEIARLTALAETSFADAWAANDPSDDKKQRVSIGLSHAKFLRERGRLAEAHAVLSEVQPLAIALDYAVLRSKVEQARAKLCAAVGLHGEALWYLSQAARRRVEVIRGLKTERVQTMARAWLDEVRAMAAELRAEAFLVPRSEAEREQIKELFAEISAALRVELRSDPPRLDDDPWRWHDRLRVQSQKRWANILGEDFKDLHPESQGDLVRADVTYHGAVDDLGRSAHLLAITLERELREHLLVPFRKVTNDNAGAFRRSSDWWGVLDGDRPPSLATLLNMIVRARKASVRQYFETAFGSESLDALSPIATLAGSISSVSDGQFNLADVRNDVAHGRSPSTSLDRLAVDAIKRALTLDAPVVLKALLKWRPTP